jgi:predicted alpha/beta-hydrolase family hydrolase
MKRDTTHYEAGGKALLVLAHGAGAGQRHPFMVTFARGLADRGIDVVTFDFAYMQQKRKAPDRAPVLEARFREVLASAPAGGPLFIGGKSMGGRIATHLAAQGVDGLRGVVALGYPLHPPGNPAQMRDAHLPAVAVPVLMVQGERDTFGTPEELAPVVARMKADVTVHTVPGGDHSFAVRGQQGADVYPPLLDVIARWIEERL